MQFSITKHATQRATERVLPQTKFIEQLILNDVQKNWKNRILLDSHPAKWKLLTKIAEYKIAEDGSIITVLNN